MNNTRSQVLRRMLYRNDGHESYGIPCVLYRTVLPCRPIIDVFPVKKKHTHFYGSQVPMRQQANHTWQ